MIKDSSFLLVLFYRNWLIYFWVESEPCKYILNHLWEWPKVRDTPKMAFFGLSTPTESPSLSLKLSRVFKLILAGMPFWPISYRLSYCQPIIDRLWTISLETRLSDPGTDNETMLNCCRHHHFVRHHKSSWK